MNPPVTFSSGIELSFPLASFIETEREKPPNVDLVGSANNCARGRTKVNGAVRREREKRARREIAVKKEVRDLLFHSSPTLAASHPPHTHTTAAPSVPPLVSPRQLVFFIFLSLSWFGGKESRKKEKIMSLNRWDVTTGTLIGFAVWRVSLCVCVCCVATAVCVQNLRCISKDIEKSRTRNRFVVLQPVRDSWLPKKEKH